MDSRQQIKHQPFILFNFFLKSNKGTPKDVKGVWVFLFLFFLISGSDFLKIGV